MPGFSWRRFLVKAIALFALYAILFVLIHVLDVVPFLDNAFTGEIETTDPRGTLLLSFLRITFYFGIIFLFTLFFVLIADRSLRAYFRSLIESINIVYLVLMVIKTIYFFSGLDKAFGFSILDGLDLAIFALSAAFNFICYKKPSFMFISPKEAKTEGKDTAKQESEQQK